LDPAELDLYTRPSEGLIKVNPRLAELARNLAGAETDPIRLVRRFWDFVVGELRFGAIHYDAIERDRPLDLALDHGWYDCNLGTALLAGLCRARGAPARLVTGYMLWTGAPGLHTWTEVWISGAGWTPFDLFSDDLIWAGGSKDPWRDQFFGRIDHRMVVERPPRLFNGPGAARLPVARVMVAAMEERGARYDYVDVDTGVVAQRDHVEVERL
jgi:transglutaminase-like putative cysteine protease